MKCTPSLVKEWIATYRNGFTFRFKARGMLEALNSAKLYGKKFKVGEPEEILSFLGKSEKTVGFL